MTPTLSSEESTLLRFVLDDTVERWRSELSDGQTAIAQDKTISSFDQMLELTGDLASMITELESIRTKILESIILEEQ